MTSQFRNPLLYVGPEDARAILETFGAAVYLVEVQDGAFRYVAHNTPATEYTGVTNAEAVGRTLSEIYGPEVASTFLPRWHECVQTGRVLQYEGYWEPPSGPRWGRITLTPLLDEDGSVRRIMGTAVDISELIEARKKRDEALTRVIEGFIPICVHCKGIREGDSWTPVEAFVAKRSDAAFSHALCPTCAKTHYPGMQEED